jgi:hypothetical protein
MIFSWVYSHVRRSKFECIYKAKEPVGAISRFVALRPNTWHGKHLLQPR